MNDTRAPVAARLAWLIGAPGLVYLLSQVLRSSVAVIERDLELGFRVGASFVGSLSGALFIAYAIAQVPMGLAIDRYGPRRTLGLGTALMVAGAVLFAIAQSPRELLAARVLMGVGAAPVFAAIMSVVAERVPADRFAGYSGRVTGIGRAGVILAGAPLAALVASVDWRGAFLVLAVMMGVAGCAMMRVLRGTRHAANAAADNLADTLAGFRNTLQAPGVAALILFQTAVTGAAFTLLAGWGVAWLRSAQGLSQAQAATALSGCALAYALGAPAWGAVPRRLGHARAWTLAGGAALAAVLGVAALGTLAAGPALWVWLAAFGFAAASYPLVLDQVRSRLPAVLMVRGVTLLGVISIGGAGLVIALAGALIDRSGSGPQGHPPAAFEHMFTLLAGLVGAATLLLGVAARAAPDPARR